jgi:hypothetical protein
LLYSKFHIRLGLRNEDQRYHLTVYSDGQFSSAQLDKYLGDFETVQEAYQEGLLSVEQLCTSFSTYIREAEGNREVADYVKANSQHFDALPKLLAIINDKSKTVEICKN